MYRLPDFADQFTALTKSSDNRTPNIERSDPKKIIIFNYKLPCRILYISNTKLRDCYRDVFLIIYLIIQA